MRTASIALLILLSPGESHTLRYRFQKGMVYTDLQTRDVRLTLTREGKSLKLHTIRTIELKRSILGVDETAHPTIERVQVIRFRDRIVEWPEDEKVGTRPRPCEGKTFIWRRLETRWGLFHRGEDGKAEDVTKTYTHLVEQLKNWRDSRLPEDPIKVGNGWQIAAADFLQTAGISPPKGVKGSALFKMESVEGGVATIPFRFNFHYLDKGTRVDVKQSGTWLFDAKNGRDVSFSMKGKIEYDKGKSGLGELVMSRKVTYSPR